MLRVYEAIPPLQSHAFVTCTKTTLPFTSSFFDSAVFDKPHIELIPHVPQKQILADTKE
jgi:hypothetical protein